MPDASPSAPPSLRSVKHDLDSLPVDESLSLSVKEHYAHLLQLAEGLQKCGFDNATIDAHVIGIFEHYKAQLLRNIAEAAERNPS